MTKKVKAVPEGQHSVTPYLIVKDAAKAIDFYKKAFGATELGRMDMPNGTIGHAEIQIGDSRVMLADECPQMNAHSPETYKGTSVTLVIYLEDVDTVFNNAIAAGGKATLPVQDQPWGDRMGTLTDPFGHVWSVATHIEDVPLEEVKKKLAAMQETQ